MESEFGKSQVSMVLKLSLMTLIVGGLHYYLFNSFFPNTSTFFLLWQIYLFIIIATFVLFTVINYRYSRGGKTVFNLFMLGTLVKMIAAILFLLPMLLSDFGNKKPDVFNFFIPYFLFLIFEIYSLTSLLRDNH